MHVAVLMMSMTCLAMHLRPEDFLAQLLASI